MIKKPAIAFFVGLLLIVQAEILPAGQLSSSLEQYKQETRTLLAAEANEAVKKYLGAVLAAADQLNGLEAGDARLPAAFSKVVAARLDADDSLTSETSGTSGVQAEQKAYNTYLQPYRKEEYINLIALQDRLLERKYFKTETAKNANYLEGLVNSRWSLTRTIQSPMTKVLEEHPHLGVSPWEAIFRIEPTIAFHDGSQVALLGTAGLSYTFFPTVDRSKTPATLHETFLSDWVQKTGGRVGVGVGWKDSRSHFLAGVGIQLNAVGLWGIYQPDDQIFMLGLSTSDLSKLQKVLPWFD